VPRPYRMGERAAAMDATRTRIIEAAIELFTERGISATTTRDIGLRADVAPGTLRKHFPTREALEAAMVQRLVAEAPLPELSILDGAATIDERLRRILLVSGTFFDQAARLYRMWLREPMVEGPWLETGRRYGERWEELMRMTLGSLATDPEANAILRAIIDPRFYQGVAGGTRTTGEAAELIAAVVTPWFAARARAATAEPGGT